MNVQEKLIKNKIGLLNLAEELGNVSRACKVMGYSRDTFYRWKELKDSNGLDGLIEKTRRKPNLKNRVDAITEKRVVEFATEKPAYGQTRVSNELRKEGIFISPGGVRSIWQRHNLERFKLRLIALEKMVNEKGIILTESQVQALERKKEDDLASGEIDTAHPGYLGS